MNKIQPDIKEILDRSEITETYLKLPDEQLDRKLYIALNKHIENCGGKWDRKSKTHIFTNTAKLVEGLERGATVNEKQVFQSFFTPSSLAPTVVTLGEVSGKVVLEPSAGEGALARECLAQGAAFVQCIELNPEYAAKLSQNLMGRERWSLTAGLDFLDFRDLECDVVIMNPPFTKNQWIKHIQHAWTFLKPGGRLVSVCPDSRTPKFFDLVKDKKYSIVNVPCGTFKESGTNVNTMILVMNK